MLYDFFLNHKFAGSVTAPLFRLGLRARSWCFAFRNAVGMATHFVRRNGPVDRDKVRRILVIRTDRIGDIVLSTPALRALRAHFPRAGIDYLVQTNHAPLLGCYEGWDNLVTVDDVHDTASVRRIGRELARGGYDVAVVGHPSSYGYKLAWWSKAPVRVGWNAKGYGYTLTHALDDDRTVVDMHQVENNIRVLRPLGVVDAAPKFPTRTTPRGEALGGRLEATLGRLWELWSAR